MADYEYEIEIIKTTTVEQTATVTVTSKKRLTLAEVEERAEKMALKLPITDWDSVDDAEMRLEYHLAAGDEDLKDD